MKKNSSADIISENFNSEKTEKIKKSESSEKPKRTRKTSKKVEISEEAKTTTKLAKTQEIETSENTTKPKRTRKTSKKAEISEESNISEKPKKTAKSSKAKKTDNIFNLTLNNDENILEIVLNENTYDIYTLNNGYQLFLGNNASSFSSTQQNLKLVNDSINLTIQKNKKVFTISTNCNINFSDNIQFSNLSKNKDIITFQIKNPFRIYSESNKVFLTNETYSSNNIITNISIPSDSNDTLIISEEDSKVYLPYTSDEVQNKFKVNPTKYDSVKDLIEKEYILPSTQFKHPIRARFREAYKLMRIKEHSSLFSALELAVELMFESHLNPAIITACKNLQELDIYLDCLDDNELDKFTCFKIVYKTMPMTV